MDNTDAIPISTTHTHLRSRAIGMGGAELPHWVSQTTHLTTGQFQLTNPPSGVRTKTEEAELEKDTSTLKNSLRTSIKDPPLYPQPNQPWRLPIRRQKHGPAAHPKHRWSSSRLLSPQMYWDSSGPVTCVLASTGEDFSVIVTDL